MQTHTCKASLSWPKAMQQETTLTHNGPYIKPRITKGLIPKGFIHPRQLSDAFASLSPVCLVCILFCLLACLALSLLSGLLLPFCASASALWLLPLLFGLCLALWRPLW